MRDLQHITTKILEQRLEQLRLRQIGRQILIRFHTTTTAEQVAEAVRLLELLTLISPFTDLQELVIPLQVGQLQICRPKVTTNIREVQALAQMRLAAEVRLTQIRLAQDLRHTITRILEQRLE